MKCELHFDRWDLLIGKVFNEATGMTKGQDIDGSICMLNIIAANTTRGCISSGVVASKVQAGSNLGSRTAQASQILQEQLVEGPGFTWFRKI